MVDRRGKQQMGMVLFYNPDSFYKKEKSTLIVKERIYILRRRFFYKKTINLTICIAPTFLVAVFSCGKKYNSCEY
ncbi:hypothetical protein CWB33_09600 [Bacillus cereus]|nr:hypothetical protein [Bacillus cereus]